MYRASRSNMEKVKGLISGIIDSGWIVSKGYKRLYVDRWKVMIINIKTRKRRIMNLNGMWIMDSDVVGMYGITIWMELFPKCKAQWKEDK